MNDHEKQHGEVIRALLTLVLLLLPIILAVVGLTGWALGAFFAGMLFYHAFLNTDKTPFMGLFFGLLLIVILAKWGMAALADWIS